MSEILQVDSLSMSFGGLMALDSISLNVNKGEIVALIGPNGAGKTTFFNCVTGIYVPTSGDIQVIDQNGKVRFFFRPSHTAHEIATLVRQLPAQSAN